MAAASFFKIFADASGETHFEEMDSMVLIGAPPPQVDLVGQPAASVQFVEVPQGHGDTNWHGAPRRQYVIWLSGTSQIEATDGERRRVGPGSVFLVDDVGSKGHRNHHDGEIRVMFVHLPEGDETLQDGNPSRPPSG